VTDVDGKWVIEVATLAGARRYNLTVTTAGTTLTGTAVGATGPIPIREGTAVGETMRFRLDLAGPVPTSLVFTLRVNGDHLTGTAQAGVFPASTVVGTRAV
jgi:hypothetical protein